MAKKSPKQLTIDGLFALGYKLVAITTRYQKFESPGRQGTGTYYVLIGKAGAVRWTRDTIAKSQSWTGNARHKRYQAVGLAAAGRSTEEAWQLFDELLKGERDARKA